MWPPRAAVIVPAGLNTPGGGPPVKGPQRSRLPDPTRMAIGPAADAVRMAVIFEAGTAIDFAIFPTEVDLWVPVDQIAVPGAVHIPLTTFTAYADDGVRALRASLRVPAAATEAVIDALPFAPDAPTLARQTSLVAATPVGRRRDRNHRERDEAQEWQARPHSPRDAALGPSHRSPPRVKSMRAGLASGSARSRRPGCGPRVRAFPLPWRRCASSSVTARPIRQGAAAQPERPPVARWPCRSVRRGAEPVIGGDPKRHKPGSDWTTIARCQGRRVAAA